MKDKYDLYMQTALQPTIEPAAELNSKIIAESKKGAVRKKKSVIYTFAKIAAAVIVFAIVAPTAAYAAEVIVSKYFVTEHSISTGNQEYVSDEWITTEEEDVEIAEVSSTEGDASVNWKSKKVENVNGYTTNTYYYYDDYSKAVADSELDIWFNATYDTMNSVYVLSETDDFVEKSVTGEFMYHGGTFFVSESIITGNVTSDCAHSIALQNTCNVRTYVSPSGNEFTLLDENRKDGDITVVRTYVMIAYGSYYGYVSFENLPENDIQAILDTVCVNVN